MFQLEKTRTEKISPKRAQEILTHENTFEGQRALRQDHATSLSVAIKDESFIKGSVAFASNGTSDQRHLMNGQHTLQAIILSEQPLTCTIDDYHCDNNDDVWRLFATFDIKKVDEIEFKERLKIAAGAK